MKNTIRKIQNTIFILVLFSQVGMAQKLNGIATYKTAASFNFEMEDTDIPETSQKELNEQISAAMQQEFALTFNEYESSYKKVASLDDAPTASADGMMIRVMGGDGVVYRNTKELQLKESADLFGKPFLIVDEPERLDWKIGSEQKQIGKFTCQKATYTRQVRQMVIDSEKEAPEEIIRDMEVVAWFTMDIPVNHGPDDYWGLPGLILEVNDGNRAYVCNKVTLNADASITIEIPREGKKVSSEEFADIRAKKMKEISEQYTGEDGEHRIMRIGG